MTSLISNKDNAGNAWLVLSSSNNMVLNTRNKPHDNELFVDCFLVPKTSQDNPILEKIPEISVPFALLANKKEQDTCKFFLSNFHVHVHATCTNLVKETEIPLVGRVIKESVELVLRIRDLPKGKFEDRIENIRICALKTQTTFKQKLTYASRMIGSEYVNLSNGQKEHTLKRITEKMDQIVPKATIIIASKNDTKIQKISELISIKKEWFVPTDETALDFSSNSGKSNPVLRVYFLLLEVMSAEEKKEFCKSLTIHEVIDREVFKMNPKK